VRTPASVHSLSQINIDSISWHHITSHRIASHPTLAHCSPLLPVCLAAFYTRLAQDTASKILSVWWPVFAFTAIGFEHSIANMFYVGTFYRRYFFVASLQCTHTLSLPSSQQWTAAHTCPPMH
jgi:formate/nitrite transporter FocA (FNT family)